MSEFLQFHLAALVTAIFGFGMFFMSKKVCDQRKRIEENGIKTDAEIIGVRKTPEEERWYAIKVSYRTQNGENIFKEWDQHKKHAYCKRHPIGSTLPIVYDANHPHDFYVDGDRDFNANLVLMKATGIGLLCFSIFTLLSAYRQ